MGIRKKKECEENIPLCRKTTFDCPPFHDNAAVSQALHSMQHPNSYHQTLFVAFSCKQIPAVIKRDQVHINSFINTYENRYWI